MSESRDPVSRSQESCPRGFDETMVSGYLDGELTQGDAQRVRLHLEQCAHCDALLDELGGLREATAGTVFRYPDDDQWDESPRSSLSGLSRGLGWLLVLVWLAGVGTYGLWELARSDESLWVRLPIVAVLLGAALLLLSVGLDRLKSLPTDRYRHVKK